MSATVGLALLVVAGTAALAIGLSLLALRVHIARADREYATHTKHLPG